MILHVDGNLDYRPNEVRHFVHKRLIRAATGFVTSGFNPIAAATGFLAPTSRAAVLRRAAPARPQFTEQDLAGTRVHVGHGHTISHKGHEWLSPELIAAAGVSRATSRLPTARTLTARPGATSSAQKTAGRFAKFGGGGAIMGGSCIVPGMRRDPNTGNCAFFLGDQVGRDDTPVGDTVMGQYGAGLVPGNHVVNRAVCIRGMVLGSDGICYNKSQISNKERAWPKGRAPLLTGGEMRAISIASTAAKRLTRTTKRLQRIGLMKRPTRRISAAQVHHSK